MKVGLILVAAGYGWLRIGPDGKSFSKLLEPVCGIPLFLYSLMAAEEAGVEDSIVVVNPTFAIQMQRAAAAARKAGHIRRLPLFVIQEDRYGSAHAVRCAIPSVRKLGMEYALVAYGDMPLWSGETMRAVILAHQSDQVLTMVTVHRSESLPVLDRYGRVLYDRHRAIWRIVETDSPLATEDDLASLIVNPSLWVWRLSWLQEHVPWVSPVEKYDGGRPEMYLPPLVRIAYESGDCIGEVRLSVGRSDEALGVNSLDELELIRSKIEMREARTLMEA